MNTEADNMRSEQQIFDTVARHLLKQGAQSVDPGGACVYRGKNGMQCAIGCLIPNDAYLPEMEGETVFSLQDWLVGHPLADEFYEHLGLLERLQHLHDDTPPSEWRAALARIAKRYGLTMPVIEGAK